MKKSNILYIIIGLLIGIVLLYYFKINKYNKRLKKIENKKINEKKLKLENKKINEKKLKLENNSKKIDYQKKNKTIMFVCSSILHLLTILIAVCIMFFKFKIYEGIFLIFWAIIAQLATLKDIKINMRGLYFEAEEKNKK